MSHPPRSAGRPRPPGTPSGPGRPGNGGAASTWASGGVVNALVNGDAGWRLGPVWERSGVPAPRAEHGAAEEAAPTAPGSGPPPAPGRFERNGAPGRAKQAAEFLASAGGATRKLSRELRERTRAVKEHSQAVRTRSLVARKHSGIELEQSNRRRQRHEAGGHRGTDAPAVGWWLPEHGEERIPHLAGRLIAAQEEERR